MSKKRALFSCAECPSKGKVFKLDQSSEGLNAHYRNCHWGISTFVCGVCELLFENKTSMIRHMVASHESDDSDILNVLSGTSATGPSTSSPSTSTLPHSVIFSNIDDDITTGETLTPESVLVSSSPQSKDMSSVAGEVVMELKATARLTNAAMERFQDGYSKLLDCHTNIVKEKMFSPLKSKGMAEDDIAEVLNLVHIEDPFAELKTIQSQLKFYEAKYGLVIPEECFLDTRVDNRLDPKTNEYVPTQVSESFQYVSVINTMKLILSNKQNRKNIFSDLASNGGVLRSYVDGSDFKDHEFLQRHENVLHICLFFDELEIAAALGSKTIVHKLGVFFFQVLNGPAHLKSKLSSIHLLALVYAQDLKKDGAFQKVLSKFVQEMKKLGSDDGVKIDVDGDSFPLRALLVAVAADSLAAHELLGLLTPSARHFCRMCMISRPHFRENGNAEAPLRTQEIHDQQVLEVKQNPRLSTQYGIKGECCLNQCPYFHCVSGTVFDAFHDILEGIVPKVLKFVLRSFVYIRKLFTIHEFKSRIASFSYGIPDSKNKPSANFVMEMLTTHKPLKQTGTQYWCLLRVFPFLVADFVPENDPHMELTFLTQDIMKIVFSFEVSHEDLVLLDNAVFKLIDNFKTLFVDISEPTVQVDEEMDLDLFEDPEELELELDHSEQQSHLQKQTALKVHLFNKLHHLKHYSELTRRKGPIVRFWCTKFEASLKIFRQYASICCNFKNPPKSMAQMFQLSHLWSLISTNEEDSNVEFGSLREMSLGDSEHQDILAEAGIGEFAITNKVIVNGEEYRPSLFIAFMERPSTVPKFSIITDIYVVGGKTAYFVLKPWTVNAFSSKYNAYKVSPNDDSPASLRNVLSLENFRPIAPWNTMSGDIYVSPRTHVL